MAEDEFSAFVMRQLPAEDAPPPIDWKMEKERWLGNLNDLYVACQSHLDEYVQTGLIKISFEYIEMEEGDIGKYKARKMIVVIGGTTVTLIPIGTLLIGTRGRVDMIGPRGTARLIMADKDAERIRVTVTMHVPGEPKAPPEPRKPIEWVWKIATSTAPVRFLELNQASFRQAILEVANG